MKYKFGLTNIALPTPCEIKRAANSILFICTTIGGISYVNNYPDFGTAIAVLGAISKGVSLFFSYEEPCEKKPDNQDEI